MAGGDIAVWIDARGGVHMKINGRYDDPVELGQTEAREPAALLLRLADALRGRSALSAGCRGDVDGSPGLSPGRARSGQGRS
jgi:hypothetical protein